MDPWIGIIASLIALAGVVWHTHRILKNSQDERNHQSDEADKRRLYEKRHECYSNIAKGIYTTLQNLCDLYKINFAEENPASVITELSNDFAKLDLLASSETSTKAQLLLTEFNKHFFSLCSHAGELTVPHTEISLLRESIHLLKEQANAVNESILNHQINKDKSKETDTRNVKIDIYTKISDLYGEIAEQEAGKLSLVKKYLEEFLKAYKSLNPLIGDLMNSMREDIGLTANTPGLFNESIHEAMISDLNNYLDSAYTEMQKIIEQHKEENKEYSCQE